MPVVRVQTALIATNLEKSMISLCFGLYKDDGSRNNLMCTGPDEENNIMISLSPNPNIEPFFGGYLCDMDAIVLIEFLCIQLKIDGFNNLSRRDKNANEN